MTPVDQRESQGPGYGCGNVVLDREQVVERTIVSR